MNYRDLEIYKTSKKLAIEVHHLSLTFKRFELYEEGSQIRRSSKGVTTAIVEGYGRRRYKGDFIKYLIYSLTECDETILHLEFIQAANSCDDLITVERLGRDYDMLSKRINKYLTWVEKNWKPGPGN
jgi:four helix bundle protein